MANNSVKRDAAKLRPLRQTLGITVIEQPETRSAINQLVVKHVVFQTALLELLRLQDDESKKDLALEIRTSLSELMHDHSAMMNPEMDEAYTTSFNSILEALGQLK